MGDGLILIRTLLLKPPIAVKRQHQCRECRKSKRDQRLHKWIAPLQQDEQPDANHAGDKRNGVQQKAVQLIAAIAIRMV
ncbi:hypothetical protein D3C80_2033250 [compost metagenome]